MHSKKIMFIDDEPDLLYALSFRFKALGFEVFSAPDGIIGIERIKALKPDLVVLDLMMPGISGYEVTRRLKIDPETSGIPILILTAAITSDLEQKIRDLNIAGCMKKPFESEELIDNIKKILNIED